MGVPFRNPLDIINQGFTVGFQACESFLLGKSSFVSILLSTMLLAFSCLFCHELLFEMKFLKRPYTHQNTFA